MKITTKELINAAMGFQVLKDKELPIRASYQISRLSSKLNDELKIYQDKLVDISKKYGKKDEAGNFVYTEDGQAIRLTEGKEAECEQVINELLSVEIDFPDITISLDDLAGVKMTPQDLVSIQKFIVE